MLSQNYTLHEKHFIAKAFKSATENSLKGNDQTGREFASSMGERCRCAVNKFLKANPNMAIEFVVDRSANRLFSYWSSSIQTPCNKWIALMKRHKKASGEDQKAWHARLAIKWAADPKLTGRFDLYDFTKKINEKPIDIPAFLAKMPKFNDVASSSPGDQTEDASQVMKRRPKGNRMAKAAQKVKKIQKKVFASIGMEDPYANEEHYDSGSNDDRNSSGGNVGGNIGGNPFSGMAEMMKNATNGMAEAQKFQMAQMAQQSQMMNSMMMAMMMNGVPVEQRAALFNVMPHAPGGITGQQPAMFQGGNMMPHAPGGSTDQQPAMFQGGNMMQRAPGGLTTRASLKDPRNYDEPSKEPDSSDQHRQEEQSNSDDDMIETCCSNDQCRLGGGTSKEQPRTACKSCDQHAHASCVKFISSKLCDEEDAAPFIDQCVCLPCYFAHCLENSLKTVAGTNITGAEVAGAKITGAEV